MIVQLTSEITYDTSIPFLGQQPETQIHVQRLMADNKFNKDLSQGECCGRNNYPNSKGEFELLFRYPVKVWDFPDFRIVRKCDFKFNPMEPACLTEWGTPVVDVIGKEVNNA